ncbi:ATPase involved in cell division [Anoxybacillus flavithermus WK1]|jgi:cell division transport system ATP-binding protein|uniref:Cell division ATP-binding protein FtsE n=3 Tax=Anoxybacillus TaxID=150247 RepID=B7GL64_ANOFW|nr:ATPase involved in cell division [Anoxybacillus flavithermus WK1]
MDEVRILQEYVEKHRILRWLLMIEMQDVYKTYPNGVIALNGISVRIKQGEFVYVVGPSGAGKSTFIKMMYREEKPTSGKIMINGVNLANIKDSKVPLLRRNIGIVFQDFKLLPKLTVYENVAFALEVIEESPKNIRKRVMEVLDLVRLKHKARFYPDELSGGEQQRVSIARSIVNNPSIVIADEPTGNLDPDTSWEIMDIFERINDRGTTIVMATHNREIVNTIRKRVIAIERGKIARDEVKGEYGYET